MNSSAGSVLTGVRVTMGSTAVIFNELMPREPYSICSVTVGTAITSPGMSPCDDYGSVNDDELATRQSDDFRHTGCGHITVFTLLICGASIGCKHLPVQQSS